MPVYRVQADLVFRATVDVTADDAHDALKRFAALEFEIVERADRPLSATLAGGAVEVRKAPRRPRAARAPAEA